MAASSTVCERFFQPLEQTLSACSKTRDCPALPDSLWLRLMVGRVLQEGGSGRAYLQQFAHALKGAPSRGNFFESLKSTRRLALLGELDERLHDLLKQYQPDRLACYPALDNFEVYAGDGHWHRAAVHDPVTKGSKYATGHFFALNLRTQGVFHLCGADFAERLKENDMRALKRLDRSVLRRNAPTGRQVIWIWDRAGIDLRQWHRWKQSAGIYFISRFKEKMSREVIGVLRWEPSDPVNQGVMEDVLLATFEQVPIRLISYRDPLSGRIFEFITNELELPPGLIVHLYRLRWDIEKVFDEFKNKLNQKKAWASSATAKNIQARVLCLTHMLLLLLECLLRQTEKLINVAEDSRRQKRLTQASNLLRSRRQQLPTPIVLLQRVTQHSLKFIRWLRSCLLAPTPWELGLTRLRHLYRSL